MVASEVINRKKTLQCINVKCNNKLIIALTSTELAAIASELNELNNRLLKAEGNAVIKAIRGNIKLLERCISND
jgi:hypothetical protein